MRPALFLVSLTGILGVACAVRRLWLSNLDGSAPLIAINSTCNLANFLMWRQVHPNCFNLPDLTESILMRGRLIGAALATSLSACATTKNFTADGYALPADKPVTVILMRPDVEVGSVNVGGVTEPNADWTHAARGALQNALVGNQKSRGITVSQMSDQGGTAEKLVAEYEALHYAVASSIVRYKYGGVRLPTKKGIFDWTLGAGAGELGRYAQGNYALFFYSRDNFASDGRKAMQVAGLIGCVIGFCFVPGGGEHLAFASLVDLKTGNIVWFNVLSGSAGDIRTESGAQAMVDRLMQSMPTRPGETPRAQN